MFLVGRGTGLEGGDTRFLCFDCCGVQAKAGDEGLGSPLLCVKQEFLRDSSAASTRLGHP